MIWKAWRGQKAWYVAGLIILTGIILTRFTVVLAGLFLGAVMVVADKLSTRTLEGLTFETVLGVRAVEIGQAVPCQMVVQNPLPWSVPDVQWKVDLPDTLEATGAGTVESVNTSSRKSLSGMLWVGRRQRVRIGYEVTGRQRGRWTVGPSTIIFRDPLAWTEMIRETVDTHHLTVWPRRFGLPANFWPPETTSGQRRGRPWDPEDLFRIRGIRPYEPGDPVRHIHPYASARYRAPMTKQLEPVTERRVEIVLHPKTSEVYWQGVDRDMLEDAVSLAATVTEDALRRNMLVGFSTSGSVPGHIHGYTRPPAKTSDAREELLTALAWVQASGTMDDDLARMLAKIERRTRGAGGFLVLVSPLWEPAGNLILTRLARRGIHIIWMTRDTGDIAPSFVHTTWRFREGVFHRG